MRTDDNCANGSATAHVREATYRPIGIRMPEGHWHVPMCIEADGRRTCALAGLSPAQISLGGKCPANIFPNASGAGYYRFALPNPKWQALLQNGATLSADEQLTLFHNVNAGLRAGQLSAAGFYGLIETIAPAGGWELLYSDHRDTFDLTDALHDLRVTGVLSQQALSEQQAFVRKHFGPRLEKLGLAAKPGEPAADTMLRAQLAQLLVEEGHDPAVITALSSAAKAYLASGGKDTSLPPELLQEAMRAAVMRDGPAFGDQLIAALQKSDDEYFIQSAIYALAGTQDEATLNKLLALSLTPKIRTGDYRYVQRYFAQEPAAKQALWAWFKANFGALEKRLSRYGMGGTPDIQRFGCDATDKAELRSFLGPRAAQLVGMPRMLKENEERIDRCIAFKAAKAAEIDAALASAR
jgi:alanyl aminopeptidase